MNWNAKKSVLARLEWFRMKEVGFDLTGMEEVDFGLTGMA
jgi:hypothetical protein